VDPLNYERTLEPDDGDLGWLAGAMHGVVFTFLNLVLALVLSTALEIRGLSRPGEAAEVGGIGLLFACVCCSGLIGLQCSIYALGYWATGATAGVAWFNLTSLRHDCRRDCGWDCRVDPVGGSWDSADLFRFDFRRRPAACGWSDGGCLDDA